MICASLAFILIVSPGCRGQGGRVPPHLAALREAIEDAGTAEAFFPAVDTISLSIPDSVLVDLAPEVRAFSGGFVLFCELSRQVVVVDKRGRFILKFGCGGAGPGEFRSMTAVTVSREDSVYVFDSYLGMVSIFSIEGKYSRRFPLKNPFLVRHIAVGADRMVFCHHAPDAVCSGFVSLYDDAGYRGSSVSPVAGYGAYYARGHLEGGLVAARSGVVFEANTFTYSITRLDRRGIAESFGSEPEHYLPFPKADRFERIQQMQQAAFNATTVRRLFLVCHEQILLQELLQFEKGSRNPERRFLVYDTSGVYLGTLDLSSEEFQNSDGDALIRVVLPESPETMEPLSPILIVYKRREYV